MNRSIHPNYENWVALVTIALVFLSLALHRLKDARHPMTISETLTNLGMFFGWKFIFYAGGVAIQYWIFTKVAAVIPWKLPHTGWALALAVLTGDFCYYWKHRLEHEMNFLWAQHSVHHSSREFNLSTSLRLPWVASYLNWFVFVPALLVGFSAEQLLLGHQFVLVYQYLIHTEYVDKLGPIERLFCTPSHHRVHHGRNDLYIDKNYGGFLIIWDKIFGTFTPETIPVDYGTVHPVTSKNPWTINIDPWKALFTVMRRKSNWSSRLKLFFSRPSTLSEG